MGSRLRRLQILGAHPSVREAPLREVEARWVYSMAGPVYGLDRIQADRIFELHDPALVETTAPEVWDWIRMQSASVVMLERTPAVPTSVAYPLTAVQAWMRDVGGDPAHLEQCFSNTLDYMLAWALAEGMTAIWLDGVLLRSTEEYMRQRLSAFYWIGVARGRGCAVHVDPASGLGTVPVLYGYHVPTGAPNHPGEAVIRMGIPGEAA